MAKTYSAGRAFYGSLTKNTVSTNLTLGDQFANDDYRAICAAKDWPFLERLRTLTTVAAQQFYNLPYDCEQVREIAVIVSSKRYVPRQSPDRAHWDRLNQSSVSSDIPEFYFVFNGQVGLWPTPVSASNTINVTQKTRVIDLSVADYTTGTITSIANAGTAVVGSSTVWTERMAGRYIRFTYSDTVNTGDGQWYEIASVTDGTHLTLTRAYGGTAIAAGTATYTIGQMPLLPEAFHDLPWMYAAGQYWLKEGESRGADLLTQHGTFGQSGAEDTGRISQLVRAYSSPTTDCVINDGGDDGIINPNLTIMI